MLGGVTRHILSHLPGVPHLHVNRPLIDNRFLFIEWKERSKGCTRALMFVLSTQRPSSCKQCEKMLMNGVCSLLLRQLSIVSIDF